MRFAGRRSEARKGGFETRPYEAKGPALGASVVGSALEVGETFSRGRWRRARVRSLRVRSGTLRSKSGLRVRPRVRALEKSMVTSRE